MENKYKKGCCYRCLEALVSNWLRCCQCLGQSMNNNSSSIKLIYAVNILITSNKMPEWINRFWSSYFGYAYLGFTCLAWAYVYAPWVWLPWQYRSGNHLSRFAPENWMMKVRSGEWWAKHDDDVYRQLTYSTRPKWCSGRTRETGK